tara:strand:- start:550 stop:741 length:192 start_codon:yes stop_codon:yes gene_type:complete
MKIIDFQDKKWIVKSTIEEHKVTDIPKLREQYNADLILSDKRGNYYILEQIIDAEFTEINKGD